MPRSTDVNVQVQPDGSVLFGEVDISAGFTPTFLVPKLKQNSVNWLASDGGLVAQIYGAEDTPNGVRAIMATVVSDNGQQYAGIKAAEGSVGAANVEAVASSAGAGAEHLVDIIKHDGSSSFAQLAGALSGLNTAIALNAGTGQADFAASTLSAVFTIAHGLGRTPKIVLLQVTGVAVVQTYTLDLETKDATNFTGQAIAQAALTASPGVTFGWLAIG